MSRFVSYLLVFVLGFSVCAFVLYELYGVPVGTSPSTISPIQRAPGRGIVALGPGTIPAAVEKMSRSVVNIDTTGNPILGFGGMDIPDFFGFRFGFPREMIPKDQASGVIIKRDGYVLTNNHVVADARNIVVTLWNHKQYKAKVVGTDPQTDLAVLKIATRDLAAATFADSSKLRVGDSVIAIGNSLGLGTTVTAGVVSATKRTVPGGGEPLESAIQTDAAINRGNSGGALADMNGNVIGINTAIVPPSLAGSIGFAIPSDTASRIAEELIKKGRIVRPPKPYIGIKYAPVDEETRAMLMRMGGGKEPPKGAGAIILEIVPDSPAARSGLKPWDVVIEINGRKVKRLEAVRDEVSKMKSGQKVTFTVWRFGDKLVVPVKVGEMPPEFEQPS